MGMPVFEKKLSSQEQCLIINFELIAIYFNLVIKIR